MDLKRQIEEHKRKLLQTKEDGKKYEKVNASYIVHPNASFLFTDNDPKMEEIKYSFDEVRVPLFPDLRLNTGFPEQGFQTGLGIRGRPLAINFQRNPIRNIRIKRINNETNVGKRISKSLIIDRRVREPKNLRDLFKR